MYIKAMYIYLGDLIRVESYVTLATKAAQFISTCHWDDPSQIVLHLIYWFIRRRFKKKYPLFDPFLGWGYL